MRGACGWLLSEGTVPEMRRGAGAERPRAQPRSATPPMFLRGPVGRGNLRTRRAKRATHQGQAVGERHPRESCRGPGVGEPVRSKAQMRGDVGESKRGEGRRYLRFCRGGEAQKVARGRTLP